jgi:hypothetical protein
VSHIIVRIDVLTSGNVNVYNVGGAWVSIECSFKP